MKITSTIIQTPFPFENNNSHAGIVTEPILGKLIGQGSTAGIFEDGNDSSALNKKYDLIGNQYNEVLEMARQESELVSAFYGDEGS
nr:protein kinase [Bacillus paranthracis]